MALALPRLYAILDVDVARKHGLTPRGILDAWLDAGVRLIQLRAKSMPSGPFLELADQTVDQTRAAGAIVIINDRADIATLSGAAGVHVGQEDLAPSDVRRVAGPSAMIGLSTHSPAQARVALSQPIDYLAIGPVFPTTSKERPDPVVGLEGVAAVAPLTTSRAIPLVAIGGITATTAPSVIEAGAASVAVVSDLVGPDPGARAREWLKVLA